MKEYINEEDYYLSWKEFHKLHPTVEKQEYDKKQKELQEV